MSGIEILLSTVCMNLTDCVMETRTTPYYYGYKDNKQADYNRMLEEYNGKHLKIGTIENFPLSYTERADNNTIIGKGAAFDFIQILKEKFNFTYEVVLPDTNMEFSQQNAETSLVTMLLNKEIDMIGAFLPILPHLAQNITYSTSLDEGDWLIMMKRPTESATGSGLLAPFTSQVWYLILIAVITFGPFIYILTWLRYLTTKDDTNKPYKLAPCVWFVYGGLIKQGTSLSPEANSTRILFATWWIFITLLSAFYTANLTAFLTLSKFTLAINEPKDLLVKNKKWIARKGSTFDYVVKSSRMTEQSKSSIGMYLNTDNQNIHRFVYCINITLKWGSLLTSKIMSTPLPIMSRYLPMYLSLVEKY